MRGRTRIGKFTTCGELNQQKRLEDAKPNFTFRPRLAVSDDRLSKHTQGEWHLTKYVKEGELFR